jgi:hypothetical protein
MTTSEGVDRAYLRMSYPYSYYSYIESTTKTQMWVWLNIDRSRWVNWEFANLYWELLQNENKNAVLVDDGGSGEDRTK